MLKPIVSFEEGVIKDHLGDLMLVAARFKYVSSSEWGSRRYLDVTLWEE